MKKREIEKRIKKELSVSSHSDFSVIMERCGNEKRPSGVLAPVIGNDTEKKDSKLKYILWLFGIFILICLMVTVMLFHGEDNVPFDNTSGYFIIDINPSVRISYDASGLVTEVSALNEDAEVLLVGTDLTGKTPSEAVSRRA